MKPFLVALTGLALMVTADPLRAQVGPNPSPYAVTPEVGPWMVCAAYTQGEFAAKMAIDMVVELRTDYKLPAYLFNRGAEQRRQYELENQQKRRQQEEKLRQMGVDPANVPMRSRKMKFDEQYAVLIGGYKDMDTAHKALDYVKKLKPPKSGPKDVLVQAQFDPETNKPQQNKSATVNPFASAFVVPNPTVQAAHTPAAKVDPFLKELNAHESFSLLKCKKPWTLLIKDFHSSAVIQSRTNSNSSFIDKLFGSRSGEELDAIGHNAHNMAEALSKMGFEAYVLHTRNSSLVTVGGFDGPKDPRIEQVQRLLASNVKFSTNDQRFGPNEFLGHPTPMEIPRP
jgi:hypothetical protein